MWQGPVIHHDGPSTMDDFTLIWPSHFMFTALHAESSASFIALLSISAFLNTRIGPAAAVATRTVRHTQHCCHPSSVPDAANIQEHAD